MMACRFLARRKKTLATRVRGDLTLKGGKRLGECECLR